jgi:hypothetical protein
MSVWADVRRGVASLGGFWGISNSIAHILLPLLLLSGSSYALVLSSVGRFSGPALIALLLFGTVGAIVGVFYLIENTRALFQRKKGRFYFGAGDCVARLSKQEIVSLVNLGEQRYLAEEADFNPNLRSTIGKTLTVKGLLLAAIGALVGYVLPFSSNWFILGGALLGIIAPYPISVAYNFFCSHMRHYEFRGELVRQFIEDGRPHQPVASELGRPLSNVGFLVYIDSFWNSLSLRFPVSAGLAAFALGRAQIVLWGFVITSAVLPFVGVEKAGTSVFEPLISLFVGLGWTWGVQHSLEMMRIFVEWNLPHTVSDFITLAIVAYGLGILQVAYQGERFGLVALPSVVMSFLLAPLLPLVKFLILPFLWILSLGRLKYDDFSAVVRQGFCGFWVGFFHLWIIGAVIGALLRTGQLLAQHG